MAEASQRIGHRPAPTSRRPAPRGWLPRTASKRSLRSTPRASVGVEPAATSEHSRHLERTHLAGEAETRDATERAAESEHEVNAVGLVVAVDVEADRGAERGIIGRREE